MICKNSRSRLKKLIVLTAALICAASCSKSEKSSEEYSLSYSGYKTKGKTAYVSNFDSPEDAFARLFDLDYGPARPETQIPPKTLTAQSFGAASASGGIGQSVIPGIRALEEYAINYSDTQNPQSSVFSSYEGGSVTESDDPLTCADWGPKTELPAAVKKPSVYVIFSQPIVPLAALGAPAAESSVMTIDPPLKGKFRWNSSRLLCFEADQNCIPQQTYTVTVSEDTRSLGGKKLTGENSFSFTTERLSIIQTVPGDDYSRETGEWFSKDDAPPEAAKKASLRFNFPVDAGAIKESLSVYAAGEKNFTVTQRAEDTILLTITDELPFDTQVTVTLKKGAVSGLGGQNGTTEDQSVYWHTLTPFTLQNVRTLSSFDNHANPAEIYFSHRIGDVSPEKHITTDPPMDIGAENIEILNKCVRLYNLPVTFNDKYTINFDPEFCDAYGRTLGARQSVEVTVPDAAGYISWSGAGVKMLEAAYPPALRIEYQNILPDSWYNARAIANPLASNMPADKKTPLPEGEKNVKQVFKADLSPFLNGEGKGFIGFAGSAAITQKTQKKTREITYANNLSVQVTDLGAAVRYGYNRAVVAVASLSSGQSAVGAGVKIYPAQAFKDLPFDADLSELEPVCEGTTDERGLAIIDVPYSAAQKLFKDYSAPVFLIEKDGDGIIFQPSSHWPWLSANIYNDPTYRAGQETARSFLFSDRGLYKPGETLTFKGIDRTQLAGSLAVYGGDYVITLEESRWQGKTVAELSGTTSSSGTFAGSIALPENLTPGSYTLKYRRSGAERESAGVAVTCGFFERAKFSVSVSPPDRYVTAGETIIMTAEASYLSGGALGGADYAGVWFREPTAFEPNTADAEGYVFGPLRADSRREHIADEEGKLSSSGGARLSQNTGGEEIIGAPYLYRVECRVTDAGNQMISSVQSAVAHPASFYIGLRRGENSSVFPQKNEKLSFDYIFAAPDGSALDKKKTERLVDRENQPTIELIREEWTTVQQNGVADRVYSRFVRKEITESSQTLAVKPNGSFSVTPLNSGLYILRVKANDEMGRAAVTEYSFYVTGSGAVNWNMDSETLELKTDQEIYNPGDTARILLKSPLPEGDYIITVEREGIFTQEVKHFDGGANTFEVPIARNYVPVVYVSVCASSPRSGEPAMKYGDADFNKPKGYYGVTPVFIDPAVKAFSVDIDAKKQNYRPGEEVTLTLTALKQGEPLSGAELTVLAVDRGVLDLIDYRVPDPIEFFYDQSHFPLNAAGGDSRAFLLDPVIYETKNLFGGDAESDKAGLANDLAASADASERGDFNPLAVFKGDLITDEKGRAVCVFTLPDSLTTYRVTALGVKDDLFALNEAEIAVSNPINAQVVAPRRLRERDVAEAGLLVTNLDSKTRTVTVTAETSGAQAFIDGADAHSVTLKSGETGSVYFDLAAVSQGTARLILSLKSDALNERIISEITIEKPYVFETASITGFLSGDGDAIAGEGIVIPSGAQNGEGSLSITLDSSQLGVLESAVSYLVDYPYACVEQKLSRLLPLAIFSEYADEFGVTEKIASPESYIRETLIELSASQQKDGGFPYWRGDSSSNYYVSLRAAHVYSLAVQKGVDVSNTIDEVQLFAYINNIKNYADASLYIKAYRLYVLSLNGGLPLDAEAVKAIGADGEADPTIWALCGIAHINKNQLSYAEEYAEKLQRYIRLTSRGADITNPRADLDGGLYSAFYGGTAEQLAAVLQFFSLYSPGSELNARLLFSLLEQQKAGGFWRNTAVTARVLEAIDVMIRSEGAKNASPSVAAVLRDPLTNEDAELLAGVLQGLADKPLQTRLDFSDGILAAAPRDVLLPLTFSKKGAGSLYYGAQLTYALPQEIQYARDEGVGLCMIITDVETGEETAANDLISGRTYRARFIVSTAYDRAFVALRAPIPSGAEILDSGLSVTASYAELSKERIDSRYRLDSSAIYDNEIQYFWNLFPKGETSVEFLFRAVRRGVYPTPPAHAECMYEPENFGRTNGALYIIR